MKYIFVLEDESNFSEALFDTIKSIDSQYQVRFFKTLNEFHEWMKIAMTKGPLALAEGDVPASAQDELRLIVAKNEILGTHNMDLIRRSQEFLIRKKFCTPEFPTAFILTAFDSPDFNILSAEEPIISNVIFKPFDKLILKQHFEFAIGGNQPLDGSTISAIVVSDKIEMLKRGQYESISEIGFTSVTNVEMTVGAMTKYYATAFQADSRKSIYAFCSSSIKTGPNTFANEFQFYAAEPAQIAKIRNLILQSSKVETVPILKKVGQPKNIVIVNDHIPQTQELRTLLQDKFVLVTVFPYANVEQLQADLPNIPENIDCVFASYELFETDKSKKWEAFCSVFQEEAKKRGTSLSKNPDLFIMSKKKLAPETFKELHEFAKDVFFAPLDRIYATKKISSFYEALALQKSTSISLIKEATKMKIATSADVKQISEAGLVMNYHRLIEIGSFREFILLRENEAESPEITGICNYNEEHKDAKSTISSNHFVFFGMRDHFLKHIRLWIRETYIRQKGEGN